VSVWSNASGVKTIGRSTPAVTGSPNAGSVAIGGSCPRRSLSFSASRDNKSSQLRVIGLVHRSVPLVFFSFSA
jgi:hypothetical protein